MSMQHLVLKRAYSSISRSFCKDFTRAALRRRAQAITIVKPFWRHNFTRPHTTLQSISRRLNARTYTSQTTDIVFPDPHRPDLFYHFVYPPTPLSPTAPAFALSFLDVPPPNVDSPTVIGWLPAQTYVTDTPDTPDQQLTQESSSTLQDFVGNPKFVALMQESIKSGLKEGVDDIWENGAKQLQDGWMHIHDQRNIPALGRIGDPDDIIGSVLVEDSKIKYETYQAMPSYRVCTSDGVLQLTPGLAQHVYEALVRHTTGSM